MDNQKCNQNGNQKGNQMDDFCENTFWKQSQLNNKRVIDLY